MFFVKVFILFLISSFILKPKDIIQILKLLKKTKKHVCKNTQNIKNKIKKMLKKHTNINIDKFLLKIQSFQQKHFLLKQKPVFFVENDLTQDDIVNFQKIIKTCHKNNKKSIK